MYHEVTKILEAHGVRVARSLVALLHHLTGDGRDLGHPARGRPRQLRLWDAPVSTAALRWGR